ncbi:hypothetical protein NIES806_10580 [Dolichospermum compactum NIES-806]|uniref:Uncharacterized protein n=1 Tax=Dolichospermum compactum NIES-806 TaxID=1973481 RepID=A0A1Z4V0A7_9CYAN|nr:hypothetical protein NIES806_10580 [Dolichospermum compactum NIES-806]
MISLQIPDVTVQMAEYSSQQVVVNKYKINRDEN